MTLCARVRAFAATAAAAAMRLATAAGGLATLSGKQWQWQ